MSDITVHYSGVDNAGDALAAGTKAIQHVLEDLDQQIATVRGQWYGSSSDAYTRRQAQWNTATEDMNRRLSTAHLNLGEIRENYANTDRGLAMTWSDIGGM